MDWTIASNSEVAASEPFTTSTTGAVATHLCRQTTDRSHSGGPKKYKDVLPIDHCKHQSRAPLVYVGKVEGVHMKNAVVRLRNRFEERLVKLAAKRILNHQNARRIFALHEGAEYARQHMQSAQEFDSKNEVRRAALAAAPRGGIVAEFGVWSGRTINMIADHFGGGITIHGFDSFEGLPEDWNEQYRKGTFHTQGNLPTVRSHVKLHKGWFEDTVPPFTTAHKGEPVALLHIDCDLYSSTKTVFDALGGNLVVGSVILFDEYFNYPEWREHEHKAFQELVAARSLKYRYISYNQHEWNAAVQITDVGSSR